jgi:hypothetical protein
MERTDQNGKPFPSEHTENVAAEAEPKQNTRNSTLRQISALEAISGEYSFQNHRVRTLVVSGDTWFVVTDVCSVLEHSDPSKAISRLDDDEKGTTIVRTPGGPQTLTVINESGLYALILTSRKPQARIFRRWVTGEVLPAIRKTGFYAQAGTQPASGDSIVLPCPDYPTRYVVSAFPGRPPHIRRTQWQSEITERTQLDCEGLCYAIKSIEVWWQKVQQMQLAGADATGGFALNRLERAVFEAASIADQYLTYGRPEAS